MTQQEKSYILATKILVITIGLLLLVFAGFNIFSYLVVRKRYRNYYDLLFYINVVLILIFSCVQAWIVPNE